LEALVHTEGQHHEGDEDGAKVFLAQPVVVFEVVALVFQGEKMSNWDELLRSMTFDFFASGGHKIEMENLLATKDAIFLDVRSRQEWESLQIRLEHHIRVLWIPIDEIPNRHNEIPRDKTVGVFCSAGTRSTIVYVYLRSLGYENVRIAASNYDAITSQLLPGKLYKAIGNHKIKQERH
jgi:rhodanese-related sulfurtransferase